jgi:hypothetical protein
MRPAEYMLRRMSNQIYTSRVGIDRIKGLIRHAYVQPFADPIRFGVHGSMKQFYGIESAEELPATLDHMVAAIGA